MPTDQVYASDLANLFTIDRHEQFTYDGNTTITSSAVVITFASGEVRFGFVDPHSDDHDVRTALVSTWTYGVLIDVAVALHNAFAKEA